MKVDLRKPYERRLALVEALRSGRYSQGTSYLKKRNEGRLQHCCLGVACEVAGFEEHETYKPSVSFIDPFNVIAFGNHAMFEMFPSEEMLRHMGLSKQEGNALAQMNDAGLITFAIAADLIETNSVMTFFEGKARSNEGPVLYGLKG